MIFKINHDNVFLECQSSTPRGSRCSKTCLRIVGKNCYKSNAAYRFITSSNFHNYSTTTVPTDSFGHESKQQKSTAHTNYKNYLKFLVDNTKILSKTEDKKDHYQLCFWLTELPLNEEKNIRSYYEKLLTAYASFFFSE